MLKVTNSNSITCYRKIVYKRQSQSKQLTPLLFCFKKLQQLPLPSATTSLISQAASTFRQQLVIQYNAKVSYFQSLFLNMDPSSDSSWHDHEMKTVIKSHNEEELRNVHFLWGWVYWDPYRYSGVTSWSFGSQGQIIPTNHSIVLIQNVDQHLCQPDNTL